MRGGDLIAEYLVRENVPYVFGLCGHGIVGLMDALGQRADRIKMIGVHHEQVAGYMADAYYRVAHRPAATFTSCGPGSVNLTIALACAMMDSSAFVAITGNVPTPQFNRGPFQETYRHHQADFPSVIRPYVKRTFQVPRPEMLPLALRQAFKTAATGRPGPVNVDVPLDVFAEDAPAAAVPDPREWWHEIDRRPAPSPEIARRALELLVSAQRPVILVGNGTVLAEAAPEVRRLAELLGIPVANTPQGAGVMPADHRLALGVVGRNGTYPANQATRQADVLLVLGARFDDRVSSGWIPGYTFTIPPTRLIHVDIDSEEIGRNYPVHLGVVADVKSFVTALLALAEAGNARGRHEKWLSEVAAWQSDWAQFNERRYRPDAVPLQPEHVIRTLRRAARRHRPRRRRCPPQLDGAAVAGLPAADALAVVGLRRDGLRRRRCARGQARRAGTPGRCRVRRRWLSHDVERRRHGRGVRHPGDVGRLEQLWLRVHPRSAEGRVRQGDDDDVQPRGDRRAVLTGLRDARARLRGRGHPGDGAERAR